MNEVPDARREGGRCCCLRHAQIRRHQHRSSFIVEQTLPVSEQFEVLDQKKGVSPRSAKSHLLHASMLSSFSGCPSPSSPGVPLPAPKSDWTNRSVSSKVSEMRVWRLTGRFCSRLLSQSASATLLARSSERKVQSKNTGKATVSHPPLSYVITPSDASYPP